MARPARVAFGTLAAKWLAGEPVRIATRQGLVAVLAVSFLALAVAWRETKDAVRPLVTAPPPPQLPPDEGDTRFGVPLATRKKVFAELAAAEPGSRVEGKRSFPGFDLAWSAEDHRGAFERQKVAAAMAQHGLSMTQVYLILDEGIRARWPGPDGEPLTPYTVPLKPRRKYGW